MRVEGRCVVQSAVAHLHKAHSTHRSGQHVNYFTDAQFNNGCGDLTDTVNASYNYRLYQKGYCPVVIDAFGNLTYDLNAQYYTFNNSHILVANACVGP
jgi:hypothetical protein